MIEHTNDWDKAWWMLNASRKFNVRSAWEQVRQRNDK